MSGPTVESLQKEIDEMRKEIAGLKSGAKPKKEKKPRAPSAFNLYMKEAIPSVKAANPGISHGDAFKKAAEEWKNRPQA